MNESLSVINRLVYTLSRMKKNKEYSRKEFLQLLGLTTLGYVITSYSPNLPGLNQLPKINPANKPLYNSSIGENPTAAVNLGNEPTPATYPQNEKLSQEKIYFLTHHEVKEGDTSRPVVMITYDDVGTFKQVEMILKAYKNHTPSKATFFSLEKRSCHLPKLCEPSLMMVIPWAVIVGAIGFLVN